jgi:hypothetical protein
VEEDFTVAAEADFMEGAAFTAAEAIPTAVITAVAMGGTEVTAAGMAAIGAILVTVTVTVTVTVGDSVSASVGVRIGRDILMRTGTARGGPPLTMILIRMVRMAIGILIRTMGTVMFPAPTLTATPRRSLLHLVT